jgi:hypothetical protein
MIMPSLPAAAYHQIAAALSSRLSRYRSLWRGPNRLTISRSTPRQKAFHRALEFWPLAASVGVEPDQEREGSEPACHQQRAAVTVLNVGGINDRVRQEAWRIDNNVPLLALIFLPAS